MNTNNSIIDDYYINTRIENDFVIKDSINK